MKKRLLALLCMVVMVVGIFAVAATNAKATGSKVTYEVGYAKVSISPWANPDAEESDADYLTLLSGIKLAGYGVDDQRYTVANETDSCIGAENTNNWFGADDVHVAPHNMWLVNDNGDEKTDRNDGLFATCTVVTEYTNNGETEGKTLVFFTMDTLNGYDYITTDMRQYVPTLLSDANVVANQIMVSGSHNHTGPNVNNLRTAYKNEFDAAVAAAKAKGETEPTYLNFAPDEENSDKQSVYYKYILDQMLSAAQAAYKDRAAATISTKSVDASDVMGVKMNYIRHYTDSNGNYGGSNFGTTSYAAHVADAEDTLQLVKFDVAAADKDIVFVTWQAHPDNVNYAGLSSDYIGGLRYRMENNKALTEDGSKENYRVAFFQGAAGNLVASSQISTEWTGLEATGIKNAIKGRTYTASVPSYGSTDAHPEKDVSFVQYGYLIGQVALSGLETGDASSWKTIFGGIRNMQYNYRPLQTRYTAEELAVAKEYFKDPSAGFPYPSDNPFLSSSHHAYHVLNYSVYPAADIEEAIAVHDGTKDLSETSLGSQTYATYAYNARNRAEEAYHNTELNAITLGDGATSLAFVTAPGEMFDRYDASGTLNGTIEDTNGIGWASTANASTYGTPILLGYSNKAMGYIPNEASYLYNSGSTKYTEGCYESNTSNFVQGTGEEMMGVYKTMLTQTAGEQRYCEHCKDTVEFAPLAQGGVGSRMVSGHYYLTEDITNSTNVTIDSNTTVCLDLNGFTWSNTYGNNVFTVGATVDPTSVLNIMDSSKGAGAIQTKARALYVRGTVNLYSGSIKTTATEAVADGDTIYISGGTVNQHGGTIYGGMTTTYGGAIRFWQGTFNMYDGYVYGGTAKWGAAIANLAGTVNLEGGEITSGTLLDEGAGECIWTYNSGTSTVVKLSGVANVEDIYVPVLSAVNIQLTGSFSGKIDSVTFADTALEAGTTVLGTAAEGVEMNGPVYVTGTDGVIYFLGISGTDLVPTTTDPVAVVGWIGETSYEAADGESTATVLDRMLAEYDAATNACIKLNKNISDSYTFSEDVYLDLNGHDAAVTVENGYTLYVLDSATDDYKGSYGSVTGTGDIQPATDTDVIPGKDNWFSAYCAYVAVDEQDGSTSYHRVDLGIKDTVVQTGTEDLGIYYDFGLYVDETLKDKITSYGVAVSTKGDPVENGALKEGQDYHKTELNTFAAGSDGNIGKSSSITNIMKQSYGYAANKRNAASTIYGTAYMVLDDNYVFAPCAENSLKSTVQAINNKWTDLTELTRTPVLNYYNAYKSIMKPWSLGNITAAAEAAEAEEEETLKILTVGNSHSMDAMWMLYEVYEQRRAVDDTLPKLELGILYYSGCHIDQHVDFAKNDLPAYEYYKINEEIYNRQSGTTRGWEQNGKAYVTSSLNTSYPGWTSDSAYVHIICDTAKAGTYVIKNGWTLRDGLQDEQWDKVILQESANYIAQSTMSNISNGDLDWLIRFVKTNAKVVPQLSFHVNWAAPMDETMNSTPEFDLSRATNYEKWFGSVSDSGDGKFKDEDGDLSDEDRLLMQRTMTQRIITNAKTYFADNNTYANVINSGVAVHHAFENYLGAGLTTNENMADVNAVLYRDYTHLSDYGRLIVANLWFEELFGDGELTPEEVVTEIPSKFYITGGFDMTDDLKTLLINAVNYALNPETAYVNPWTTE